MKMTDLTMSMFATLADLKRAEAEQEGPDGEDGPWAPGWEDRCPKPGDPDPFTSEKKE